jgi:predicted amidohydrolase
MLAAAVQVEVALGDAARNLDACERLAREAAADGARVIALPEFFPTGAAFLPEVAAATLAPDGAAASLLSRIAREEAVWIGGSFLCRDGDGEVRNAYLLAGPDGRVLGRHDKDLPTMWENALYVPGSDDGVIDAGDFTAGAAVCWELMRTGTARRLRGRVDLVIGGSNWWSVPAWPPRELMRRQEAANRALAHGAPAAFGRYVGAPVVHAAQAGAFSCPMPDLPGVTYRGAFEGGALIADAAGRVLAFRAPEEGEGYVLADVEIARVPPVEQPPDRFWLHRRGVMAAWSWTSQRLAGRRWYACNVRGRPALELEPARA